MEDEVQRAFAGDELADIMPNEMEARIALQLAQVFTLASDEIIHSDDGMAFRQEAIA